MSTHTSRSFVRFTGSTEAVGVERGGRVVRGDGGVDVGELGGGHDARRVLEEQPVAVVAARDDLLVALHDAVLAERVPVVVEGLAEDVELVVAVVDALPRRRCAARELDHRQAVVQARVGLHAEVVEARNRAEEQRGVGQVALVAEGLGEPAAGDDRHQRHRG
jgi:hypothetical protein